jgi:dienelactone hydrolase
MLAILLAAAFASSAQAPQPAKENIAIRGQRQDLYCYLNRTPTARAKILFLPGDGGWRGFAIDIAETVASWGYSLCGMDTKRYLESFTSGRAALKETDVAADLRTVAAWVGGQARERVIYLGWSEGANLGVLATASAENRQAFKGLAVLGLSERGVLGWRWADNVTYLTKKEPDEPHYQTVTYLPKIAPLPFLMIHSSHDEYTPVERARKLFESAGEPKRFRLVDAQNHRFDGAQGDFFRGLREGLEWVNQTAR